MIPIFPEFKKLELSDKKDIESFVNQFAPYSDFNFVSMYSWDVHRKMEISQLHGNLVVLFYDYVSNEPFLSFIGKGSVKETVEFLLKYSNKHYHSNILRLIPEVAINSLVTEEFNVLADRDAYDYIYSVKELASMDTWTGSSVSRNIKQFFKLNPSYCVVKSSVENLDKKEYLSMFKRWAKNKSIDDHESLNEYKAFERFLQINDNSIEVVSVYLEGILVGFSFYEVLPNEYAMSHFLKVDIGLHKWVGDVLNWEEAKFLKNKGVLYYNWEQDLGLPGLRKSKEKYRPHLLLQKYTIDYKD